MKKLVVCGSVIVLALLLAFGGSIGGGAYTAAVAFAQEATPVPNQDTQAAPAQTTQQNDDNNEFPWGLLGLLGLAGLAGLRRQPEPVQRPRGDVSPAVGVYDSKK
jgi:hypothetical protein